MERSAEFDLATAIEQYLSEINRHHLLNKDEKEELFVHLMDETKALSELGLSQQEAFTVSKLRFGDAVLINREYERVKPFGVVRKTMLNGLMLIFWMLIVVSIFNSLSFASFFIGDFMGLIPYTIKQLDLGIRFLFLGGMFSYLVYRVIRQKPYKIWEIILIPLLGFLFPLGVDRILIAIGRSGQLAVASNRLIIEYTLNNSATLFSIVILFLVFSTYILFYKERNKVLSN